MKKGNFNLIAIYFASVITVSINAQGLSIGTGATFSLGSSILSLSGNWSNSGTFIASSGTVVFNGASGNQTITNASSETFNHLTINKAENDVILASDIIVSGLLTFTSGDLDLDGNVLTLTGSLSETAGNTVKGTSGYITCTSDLNAPDNANPHNIGFSITSSANLGTTTIKRGHTAQTGSGNSGIQRYFEITPTENVSLNASIVFNYDHSELNSIDESTLKLFDSEDHGTNWNILDGTLNEANNTYNAAGLNSLNRFTLASSIAPLPVELISFAANVVDNCVLLNWQTATEVNNYGFEVERTSPLPSPYQGEGVPIDRDGRGWQKVGFVAGHGNSNSTKEYSFSDDISQLLSPNPNLTLPKELALSYRMKQIDNDGSFSYSDEIIVEMTHATSLPTEYALYQNYPNPFNPVTTIKYSIPSNVNSKTPNTKLVIFDILGNEVATLVNENKAPGFYEVQFDANKFGLSSGTYFYKLTTGEFVQTKKLLLLK